MNRKTGQIKVATPTSLKK